jgi:hypothetical protein
VIAVLGLERFPSLLLEGVRNLVALPVSAFYRVTRGAVEVGAPTRSPTMTLRQVEKSAGEILAGAAFSRHLLWRYSLFWAKPAEVTGTSSR